MNTHAQKREKKIEAAEKARGLIQSLGNTRDLEARATMLHDRVSEGIKGICDRDDSFTETQIEILTEMAVHLALIFDKDMQRPLGFWARCMQEYSRLGALGKMGTVSIVLALLVSAVEITTYSVQGAGYFYNAFSAKPNSQNEKPVEDITPQQPAIKSDR